MKLLKTGTVSVLIVILGLSCSSPPAKNEKLSQEIKDEKPAEEKKDEKPAEELKAVRVILKQTIKKVDAEVNLPFNEYVEPIMKYAGYKVVEDGSNYDATLSIDAVGIPDKALYDGDISGFHWTKATVKGTIVFSEGNNNSKWIFSGSEGPAGLIMSKYPTPNNAPFEEAFKLGFVPVLFRGIGKVKGISPLISALKDENASVCEVAAKILGEIRDPQSVEPLIIALKDVKEARQTIAEALGKIKDPRAVEPLIDVLTDSYGDEGAIADALGEFKDPRAVEPLVSVLLKNRWAAVRALGKINPNWRKSEEVNRHMPMFISALNDQDTGVREAAAYILGEIKDTRAVEPLIAALKDEETWVVETAADSLRRITGKNFGEDQEKWQKWWENKTAGKK